MSSLGPGFWFGPIIATVAKGLSLINYEWQILNAMHTMLPSMLKSLRHWDFIAPDLAEPARESKSVLEPHQNPGC